MADTIRFQETANGPAYTYKDTTIVFPEGANPWLLWVGGSRVDIDRPERFGRWTNAADRRAYLRAFVDAPLAEESGYFRPLTLSPALYDKLNARKPLNNHFIRG